MLGDVLRRLAPVVLARKGITRARASSRCVKIATCAPPSSATSSAPGIRSASALACRSKGTAGSSVPWTVRWQSGAPRAPLRLVSTALRLAAALLVPAATAAAAEVRLARATGTLVEAGGAGETYWAEKGISADDAGAIRAFLRRRGDSKPQIVRVPGRPRLFLASDFAGGTGADYGRCLFLLESSRGEIRELARTRGEGNAYSLKPVAFAGGGRTIVLAERASESSGGVWVHEIAGNAIRELGEIDAAVPGELGPEDPTPFAKVTIEGGKIVVRFDTDLVLGTGKEDAPIAKRPVVFRQAESGFVRVAAAKKAKPR